MSDEQAGRGRSTTNKDKFLEIVKTGSGGYIAFAVNAVASNIHLSPEKMQQHLMAVSYVDYEPGGWARVYLYLDNGVYMEIKIEYDKETKQIKNTEVDIRHLSECYCGE